MARVYNWQLGREMSYWYPEARPKRQFAAVFDINKCIACQTCTLACKTTWTQGKGQEYMLWNNVETKPYGFYPLGWDVKLLEQARRRRRGTAARYDGQTIFEAAPRRRARPRLAPGGARLRPPERRRGRLRGPRRAAARTSPVPHLHVDLLPGPHLQPLHLPGVPGRLPARLDLQAARGRHRARRPGPLPRLPGVRQGLPVQEGLLQPDDRDVGEVHRLLPEDRAGPAAAVLRELHRQDPPARVRRTARRRRDADNPIDYLVHVRKVALPLFPQFGLEPNVYYIPPIHVPDAVPRADVRAGRATRRSKTYRNAPNDPDLAGLLALFGSTEQIIHRFKRRGDTMFGYDENGKEIVRVPLREPVHVRTAFDARRGVARANVPREGVMNRARRWGFLLVAAGAVLACGRGPARRRRPGGARRDGGEAPARPTTRRGPRRRCTRRSSCLRTWSSRGCSSRRRRRSRCRR